MVETGEKEKEKNLTNNDNNNNNDIYRAQTSPTQQMRQISRCMH